MYVLGELDENIDPEEVEENVFEAENAIELNAVADNTDHPNSDSDSDSISEEDDTFVPEAEEIAYHGNTYPGVQAKKVIVDYWVLPNNKRRKFSVVQNRHRKVQSVRQLRQWRKDILEKGKCLFIVKFRRN